MVLGLAKSSIRDIKDLWSFEKIEFLIEPKPQIISDFVLEEIVFRSIEKYLERPGHVLLPDGMIPEAEIESEQGNNLLRVRMLWRYWHGSSTLNCCNTRFVSEIYSNVTTNSLTKFQVHVDVQKLERPLPNDSSLPLPIQVQACFDKIVIDINPPLLGLMESHLKQRESFDEEDTDFDRWIHAQIYQPEYNTL